VTTLTEHDATPIMQLLNPPLVHRPPLDKSRSAPEEDTGNVHDNQEEVKKDVVIRQSKVVESDDDVFVSPTNNPVAFVQPPTPKPRLSRGSITESERGDEISRLLPTENQVIRERKITLDRMPDVLERAHALARPLVPERNLDVKPDVPERKTTGADSKCPPPDVPERKQENRLPSPPEVPARRSELETKEARPTVPERKTASIITKPEVAERKPAPQIPERPHKTLERTFVGEPRVEDTNSPVSILHRGILHIRSQLRKQSSSNSASALPVIGSGSTSSIPSALMICTSSPRWIRQNAVFYSNNELEILNPVSRSSSVSSTSGIGFNSNKNNCFRVKIARAESKTNALEFAVMPATEVHSRPFAFKITSGGATRFICFILMLGRFHGVSYKIICFPLQTR